MALADKLSLTDFERYNGGPGQNAGRYLRFRCPIHGGDKQKSLRLDPDTGHYNCFQCGASGYTLEATEKWIEEKRREEGRDQWQKKKTQPSITSKLPTYSLEQAQQKQAAQQAPVVPNMDIQTALKQYQKALPGSPGEKYLTQRDIPLELAQQYGVGFAGYGQWIHRNKEGKLVCQWRPGRVVFPHHDQNSQIVNLYGRVATDELPAEYKNKHDHLPFGKGIFNSKAAQQNEVVFVTEGVFDAMSLIAAGYPNTIAIYGVKGMRWDWVKSKKVVLCLDNDQAGQEEWRKLALEGIMLGKEIYYLPQNVYRGCKDLNEVWVKYRRIDVGVWERSSEVSVPKLNVTSLEIKRQEKWDDEAALKRIDNTVAAIGKVFTIEVHDWAKTKWPDVDLKIGELIDKVDIAFNLKNLVAFEAALRENLDYVNYLATKRTEDIIGVEITWPKNYSIDVSF